MPQNRPKRIFVNDVDEYSSKHIAKFLAACEAKDEEAEETSPPAQWKPAFHVVGTISGSSKDEKIRFVREQYEKPTNRDELLKHMLECDVVIYNVSESSTQQQVEEATWAVTALHAEMKNFKSCKLFILVSSVMTWAMTTYQKPGDLEGFLSEEEFTRRRPHPSFRNHRDLEKLVLKLARGKKSKLKGFIAAAGLQYGMEENLFHYFFKISWLMQVSEVPIFGNGTNYIPIIHVYDLGRVIQNIIKMRPKLKYILAIDNSWSTLEEIVKAISDELGPEKVHKLSLQDAVAMKAFKPEELSCLSINLRLDAVVVNDIFNLTWTCKGGITENIKTVVMEYKDTRQMQSVKICLVGPPAVGKTTVAKKLCQRYKIHHIQFKDLLQEKSGQLQKKEIKEEPERVNEEESEATQEQLERINKSLENNQGHVAEQQMFDILREKLNSKPCRNHGFVLDGFPETYEQAKVIFCEDEPERQDSDLMSIAPWYNKIITPEYIFAMDASDDFLTKRVQGLPESVAEKMHYTPDEYVSRLASYRELCSAEETLLDFFDHREIHPEHIEVNAEDLEYSDVLNKITKIVGAPKNYGLSPEEKEEENQRKENERRQKLAAEAAKRKSRKNAALAKMAAQYEDWQKNLSELKQQERELQQAQALPLKNSLMKQVMPSMIKAMFNCSKIKPDNPVDFLAEHLLRSN